MTTNKKIKNLPKHLHVELKQLQARGIYDWLSLKELKETELFALSQNSHATTRNLKFLRGMANLICQINLSESEAALLLHAGIGSVAILKSLTPSQLVHKVGRLERQLNLNRKPYVDLKIAKNWIKSAERANSELTQ